MSRGTDLLIIGAVPFGLGMVAYAQHLGFDYQVVGKPMEFWKSNMPKDLVLRSACDWHLDPVGVHTVDNYLQTLGLTSKQVEPLSLEFYLSYTDWFRQQKRLNVVSAYVERLSRLDKDSVKIWPKSRVASCLKLSTGEVEAAIDTEVKEDRIVVDHII